MTTSFRRRVGRLEQASRDPNSAGPIRSGKSSSFAPAGPDRQAPTEFQDPDYWRERGKADYIRRLEADPEGVRYRERLARLGLPQPATLVGIDLLAETFRLACVPDPVSRTKVAPTPGTDTTATPSVRAHVTPPEPGDSGPPGARFLLTHSMHWPERVTPAGRAYIDGFFEQAEANVPRHVAQLRGNR
jgi:hypothetical protein